MTSTPVTAPQAPKRLSLRANFTWTFVGNVVYAASSWLMLVMLAKLGTPETVGRFSLGLAITAPIIVFANLQLRAIQATDVRADFLFRDYLGLRIIMMILALLLISMTTFASGYERETALVILIIGLGKAVDSFSDVIYGQLQRHERMNMIAVSMILKGILSLILMFAGQALTHSVVWAAMGWSIASLIVTISYDLHSGRIILGQNVEVSLGAERDSMIPRFRPTNLRRLAWLALPLGITTLLISLNTNIPRYFVEGYAGEYGLGIYSALAYLMIVGSTVISALGQSTVPQLAKLYTAGDATAFRRLMMRLVLIALLLGGTGLLASLVAGRFILTLVYQAEYAKHADVFTLLMLAATITYVASSAGYGITAVRNFKIQPAILAICILTNFVGCALLIPAYGLSGAAWTLILTNAIQLVLMHLCVTIALRNLPRGK